VTLLAVKPQIMRQVCEQLRASAQRIKPLIISIAAGLRQEDIDRWLGGQLAIVRVMPNQPALIGQGASAAFANAQVSKQQRDYAEQILRTAGALVWLKSEAEIDAATAISGSGPAYFFLLMEMMYEQALSYGLDAQAARTLVMNTALGASAMADQSALTLQKLREQVTSPGGTTEAAVTHLLDNDLRKIFAAALDAARDRAQQMADDAANT
jgi:pyrroline-5-carboxylate reductase